MQKVRLGVIGTGLVFRHFHWPVLRELSDRIEIVALCNRTVAKAEDLASQIRTSPDIYTDYHDLIERDDVHAVLVAVPIHLTASVVQDAISNDKHVLQEKPIADQVAMGERSISLAKQRGVVLMVGENFRYRSEFRQVHRLVEDGIIGQPKLYRLNDIHYTYPDGMWSQTPWRHEGKHDGGYLIDGGTHIIAGMSEMVRRKVKLVHGLTASFNPDLLSMQDDTLLLHLVFENGMVGQMALGYGAMDQDARRPKVYGDKGTLVLSPRKKRIELWPVEKDAEIQTIPMETANNDFRAEWLEFHSAVVDGVTPYSTPEESLVDLRIIQAGRQSAATGKTIVLQE